MTILFAILLFSLLIFVHELGHFVAAKLSGVQVNEFSMFMGPAIAKWQRGETLYAIRTIPVGGYCAMEGEDVDTDNPRSFQKAAWWKRLIILVAGATMNFLIGVLIYGLLVLPARQVVLPQIHVFDDCCTFNGEDGLQVGDTILEIDGEKVFVNGDISILLNLNKTGVHDLKISRDGEILEFQDYAMGHTHTDENGETYIHYGFGFGEAVEASFGEKMNYVWKMVRDDVRMIRISLHMLLSGQAGIKDMTGPVGIVQIMSETAADSKNASDAFQRMLSIGAFIAINLAVMNLLPIPALDGGRVVGLVLTTAVEAITGKKLNPKYEGFIHGTGMVLLLALMAVILFKDVFTIFKG